MDPSLITQQEKDGLKEICNIGASKTASFLTEELGKKFNMEVMEVNIIDSKSFLSYYRDLTERFEDPLTVKNDIEGVNGNIILASSEDHIRKLLGSTEFGKKFENQVEKPSKEAAVKYLEGINDFISLGASIKSTEVSYKYADPLAYETIMEILESGSNGDIPKIMVNITTLFIEEERYLDMIMLVGVDDIDKILEPLEQMLG